MGDHGFNRSNEANNPETNEQAQVNAQDQQSMQSTAWNAQPSNPEKKMSDQDNDLTIQDLLAQTGHSTALGSNSSAELKDFKENVEEVLKNDRNGKMLKLDLITNNPNLAAPGINLWTENSGVLFYFSIIPACLIAEGRLNNREEYLNSVKTEIDMPASKVFDKDYCAAVESSLRSQAGPSVKQVRNCHYYVLPASMSLKDERTAKIVVDLAFNCISQNIAPSKPLAAQALRSKKIEVTLNHQVNDKRTSQTTDGTPVAADVVVSMMAQGKTEKNQGPNSGMAPIVLSRSYVKLDLIKMDPRLGGMGMHQMPYGMMQGPVPAYHPVLILTDSEGYVEGSSTVVENPGTSACALASLCQLAVGRNFMSLLDTRTNHPRNVGLLGYDHEPMSNAQWNPRKLVVERTNQASKEDHRTMQEMGEFFFHPNSMTVMMDIGDGTRSSYAHAVWLAIANGDTDANEYMISILDTFTGGHFAKMWAETTNNAMLTLPGHTLIHNGTFEGSDGAPHDLREIDYFYMLEACKEQSADPSTGVAPFMATFAPGATNGADGLRALDVRRKAYHNFDPTVTITGFSRRVTMHQQLSMVIARAVHAANLHFNPSGLYDEQTNHQLAYQGFVPGTAVDHAMVSAILQPQFNQNGQNIYGHNPYMPGGGWGR
ncbi:hypothetical protein [Vibrio phage BONAISHI]|nr:hypothetical protein [Vibrio phage BONAISHI]